MPQWHECAAAQALIAAIHDLDRVSNVLEQHRQLLMGYDPAAVVGQLRNERAAGLVHLSERRWHSNGGSAIEACIKQLDAFRDDIIEATLDELCAKRGWSRESDERNELWFELLRDTDSTTRAIDLWRAAHSDHRKAA